MTPHTSKEDVWKKGFIELSRDKRAGFQACLKMAFREQGKTR